VSAGDVIESVNHTGNANGYDHLHFEVRLGGPNGTRVDPRPTLDAAGCTPVS
jgi:murein DD-endopeptidase MepM/ murein hydrolase activator NlpD